MKGPIFNKKKIVYQARLSFAFGAEFEGGGGGALGPPFVPDPLERQTRQTRLQKMTTFRILEGDFALQKIETIGFVAQ